MIDSRQILRKELTQEEFPQTWEALKSGLADGVAPGFVAGLWEKSRPDEIRLAAFGNRRHLPSSLPMVTDTVFDLASVTKVFATAPLAAVLVERGWLNWNTPVSAIFPNYPHHDIEVRHLLAHTAGFVAWQPLWEKLRDDFAPVPLYRVPVKRRQQKMREQVLAVTPEQKPEGQAVYSDISFLLLGFLLEEITQMDLDQAVRKFVWDPMGIQDSYYRRVNRPVDEAVETHVAATENCPWRGAILQGQVHDENCWAMGGYAGHAGAFGTARDVLHFARGLMSRFLSDRVLQEAWNRVSEPPGCGRTLGWDTPSGELPAVSHRFSARSVGHLGFTGTSLWIDLDAELAVVLLSNRIHPTRENIKIRALRPRFHEAIRLDLRR